MNIFNSDVKMYIYYVGKYSFRCGKRLFCENIKILVKTSVVLWICKVQVKIMLL